MDNLFPDKNEIKPHKYATFSFAKNLTKNPRIQIGDYTYFDGVETEEDLMSHIHQFFPYFNDKLIIGKFCQIANNVDFVMNAGNHNLGFVTTYPFCITGGKFFKNLEEYRKNIPNKGDIIIGNDVWIGENATILPGVKIGDGCVIGTNSTVAKDIPAYSVVVGNSGRVIKKRFDDETIEFLEKLQWWNMSIEQIDKILPLLTSTDIKEAKEKLKEFYED